MQVVDTKREPIEGLYAIGVDGCKLYRHVYPINVAATCCANNVISGRTAIKHIQANL
jgi:fumarate reductase flavoprotein subunit